MSKLDTMSQRAIESAFERESEDDYVTLLEVDIIGVSGKLRFVNQAIMRLLDENGNELEDDFGVPVYGVMHKGNPFVYLQFSMPMPTSEPGQPPQTSITLDNTDGFLTPYIRELIGKPKLRMIIVHSSDYNLVQDDVPGLKIHNFDMNDDDDTVTASIMIDIETDNAFPAHTYDYRFPGAI